MDRFSSSIRGSRFRAAMLSLLIAFSVSACVMRAPIEKDRGVSEVLVRALAYDDHGFPVLGTPLAKRPNMEGDSFTLVQLLNGRPVKAFDIVVVGSKPDFTRPLKALYRWTGRGFSAFLPEEGNNGSEDDKTSGPGGEKNDQPLDDIELGIGVAVVAVVAVGGIVVGVLDGIRQTAIELGKVVTSEEKVVACTEFEYDGFDRLSRMRMLGPDLSTELVLTRFEYEDTGPVPARTVVVSPVEKKVYQVGMPSWMEHWEN